MSAIVRRPLPAQSPFPVQSIPRSTSAKIEDQKGKLMAVGALIRFTNNQAYFILQHLDSSIADKAVTVSSPNEDNPLDMRISAVFEQHPNRSFMPMYIQVYYNPEERLVLEHLVDQLAETTLGRYNLELRKNMTIDVFDSDADCLIRDNAGFIVADRLRLQQLSFDAKGGFAALQPSTEVVVSKATNHSELLQYDSTLSNHNRKEFLQFLFAKNQVYVAHWDGKKMEEELKSEKEEGGEEEDQQGPKVAGYLVAARESVMCLYAENQAIADALLAKYIGESRTLKSLSICCSSVNWTNLRSLASLKTRPIFRRHTRAVPSNIKLERIFALNVGVNIF